MNSRSYLANMTERQRLIYNLARAPLPVTRRIPGKTWAGALITNDDFGLGRYGRGSMPAFTGEPDDTVYFPDSHQEI